MLKYMPMSDVPFFIAKIMKQQGDDILWEQWLHKYDGKMSYAEFKEQALSDFKRSTGSGLTAEQKQEQEKQALDFATQFIQFAPTEGA